VRQLNTYGFRKVDPDRWEFANENFLQGQPELLKSIHRRKTAAAQPSMDGSQSALVHSNAAIEIGQFGGLKDEVEALKRDKNVLMLELVRLRQQQQWTDNELRSLAQRVNVAENRQVEMLHLFSRFLHNPGLLSQMLQAANKRGNRVGSSKAPGRRKRRNRDSDVTMDGMENDNEMESGTEDNQLIQYKPPNIPGQEYTDALLSLLDTLTHGTAFQSQNQTHNHNQGHTEFGPSIPVGTPGQGDALAGLADLSSPSAGTELERAGLELGIPVEPSLGTSNQPGSLERTPSGPSIYQGLSGLPPSPLANSPALPFSSLSGAQPSIVFPPLDSTMDGNASGAVRVATETESALATGLANAEAGTVFKAEDPQAIEPPADGYSMVTPFSMGSSGPMSPIFAAPNGHDVSMDFPDSLPSLKSSDLMMMESEALHNAFQRDDSLWKEFLAPPEETCGLGSLKLEDQPGT